MRERILVAKPGLDGHDRGAKIIAYALRDAGFEVIYTGIRQRPRDIITVAVQEDVDVIGLSILSGSHMSLTQKIIEGLLDKSADDIAVVVGGTIPKADCERLLAMGAAAVFGTGSHIEDVVDGIKHICETRVRIR